MARLCWKCREKISRHHTGYLCYACQEKRIEKMVDDGEDLVDVEGYAEILGLDSAEQLRRLARDGVLAPRIPGITQWRWRKKDIEAWFKQKQRTGDVFRTAAMGMASNLRRCSNDSIIYCLSDTIEDRVYGVGPILGTTASGRGEPIELVKVDRSVALKILEDLPENDFPELVGIVGWEDLPYDRINEDLIVRLESYF